MTEGGELLPVRVAAAGNVAVIAERARHARLTAAFPCSPLPGGRTLSALRAVPRATLRRR